MKYENMSNDPGLPHSPTNIINQDENTGNPLVKVKPTHSARDG